MEAQKAQLCPGAFKHLYLLFPALVVTLKLQILRNAISKTCNRITDLRKEIPSLKMSLVSVEEAALKAKAELEASESKLMLVDGEPTLGENPVRMKRLRANAERTKEKEDNVRDSLEAKEALLARALAENEVYMGFCINFMLLNAGSNAWNL